MIRPRESAVGNENVATPAQAAELMRRIHTCELPMSKPRCDELRGRRDPQGRCVSVECAEQRAGGVEARDRRGCGDLGGSCSRCRAIRMS